jgi:hypothetical protein
LVAVVVKDITEFIAVVVEVIAAVVAVVVEAEMWERWWWRTLQKW